jgi:hypothetical protein
MRAVQIAQTPLETAIPSYISPQQFEDPVTTFWVPQVFEARVFSISHYFY